MFSKTLECNRHLQLIYRCRCKKQWCAWRGQVSLPRFLSHPSRFPSTCYTGYFPYYTVCKFFVLRYFQTSRRDTVQKQCKKNSNHNKRKTRKKINREAVCPSSHGTGLAISSLALTTRCIGSLVVLCSTPKTCLKINSLPDSFQLDWILVYLRFL